ncbi:MAG TPA: hypothetical protein VF518_05820, partial [Polyangia bacterium]
MRRLLFVAPAVPCPTGSGLQMRAWVFLRGLARDHAVTLVAGSPGFPAARPSDLDRLAGLVEETILLDFRPRLDPHLLLRSIGARLGWSRRPSWDWAEPTLAMRARLAHLRSRRFSHVHVFRLYMLPVALAAMGPDSPRIQLDLDDWESETRLAISKLAAQREPALTTRYRLEAAALAEQEGVWLARLSRVFVCSKDDAAALAARHGLRNLQVVANSVAVPAVLPAPSEIQPPELIFIGSLGY